MCARVYYCLCLLLNLCAGDVLATVETKQAPNSCAAVSPCGKFIACSGEEGNRWMGE